MINKRLFIDVIYIYISMKALNFYERAVLHELVKLSEEGVLSRSYQQIANEIGGFQRRSVGTVSYHFIGGSGLPNHK